MLPGVCSTVRESCLWPAYGVQEVRKNGLADLLDGVRGTHWSISSGCSGILTFELGARASCKALGCSSSCLWSCEKNAVCREEQLALPLELRPQEMFGNYNDFLQPHVLVSLQALRTDDPNFITKKRELIMGTPTNAKVWSLATGQLVPVGRATVHAAGTPCVHDSAVGKREKQRGRDSYIMLIFCRQRRDLKEPIWVSENVPEHPVDEYMANLADIYDIEVIMTDPVDLGWKIRRARTQ